MSVDLEEAKEEVREETKGITIYPFGFVVKWIYKLIKRMKMKKILFIILFLLGLANNVLADNFCARDKDLRFDQIIATTVSGVNSSLVQDTTSTEVIAAQGAGKRTVIESICVQNSDAAVGTWVSILDGATTKWKCYAAVAGGGCCLTLPSPLIGTANTAWNIQAGTTSAEINASLSGCVSAK